MRGHLLPRENAKAILMGANSNQIRVGNLCVFCGEAPVGKTKEHVVPKWLLEITETSRKKLTYGGGYVVPGKTPFSGFTLPACEKCNNEYSVLEGSAGKVVSKILLGSDISPKEADVILDWIDKVRIGLWLIDLVRGGNKLQIEPKFRISARVGLKDRALKISRIDYKNKALSFVNINTLAFQFAPCCYSLIVNDVILTSISFDGATSRALGYKYGEHVQNQSIQSEKIMVEIREGTGAAVPPEWKGRMITPGQYIFQSVPAYVDGDTGDRVSFLSDRYFCEEAIDAENLKGAIFTSRNLTSVERVSVDGSVSTIPSSTLPPERGFLLTQMETLRVHDFICRVAYPAPRITVPGGRVDEITIAELHEI